MTDFTLMDAFVWCLLFAGPAVAGPGYSIQCCDVALQTLAYLNKSVPQADYKCGQLYEAALPPALPLLVSTSWCRQNCPGYALSTPGDTNAWAAPLIVRHFSESLPLLLLYFLNQIFAYGNADSEMC